MTGPNDKEEEEDSESKDKDTEKPEDREWTGHEIDWNYDRPPDFQISNL